MQLNMVHNRRYILEKRRFCSISSQLVLVFMSFGGPYLAEFESYGDSESTFTCLTFHFESIDILGFSERHREVA